MAASRIEFHQLWIEQCAAAQRIKQRFGLGNALEYLVGEKLLRFVEAAEHNPLFAQSSGLSFEITRTFNVTEVGNYAVGMERTKRLNCAPARGHSRNLIDISVNPVGWFNAGL